MPRSLRQSDEGAEEREEQQQQPPPSDTPPQDPPAEQPAAGTEQEDPFALPTLPDGGTIPRQFAEELHTRASDFASQLSSLSELQQLVEEAGGPDAIREGLGYADLMATTDGQASLVVQVLRHFGIPDDAIASFIESQGQQRQPTQPTQGGAQPGTEPGDQPPSLTEDRIKEIVNEAITTGVQQPLQQQQQQVLMQQSTEVVNEMLQEAGIPARGRQRDAVLHLIDAHLAPEAIDPESVRAATKRGIEDWKALLTEVGGSNGAGTKKPAAKPLSGGAGSGPTNAPPKPPASFEDAIARSRQRFAERFGIEVPTEGG